MVLKTVLRVYVFKNKRFSVCVGGKRSPGGQGALHGGDVGHSRCDRDGHAG